MGVYKIKGGHYDNNYSNRGFKSKQNFSEFMAEQHPPIITSTLANYPKADGKTLVTFAELTQNYETLMNHIGSDLVKNLPKAPFIIWIIANEREKCFKCR